jgi:hypothetical protein
MLSFDPISIASAVKVPAIVVHQTSVHFLITPRNSILNFKVQKNYFGHGNHYDYYDNPTQIDNAVKNIACFFNDHLS